MTRKIFRSILTVGVAVLACSLLLVMGCFYSFYEGMQEHQLGDELRIAAAAVETNGSTYLEKIKSDRFRVTWIASDGTVLYDTQADAAQMENHLEREEVREALETGTGSSSRYSATLLQKTVYSASRLTDGTVLRLSASRATMGALLLGAFQPILLVVIVLLVVVLMWAYLRYTKHGYEIAVVGDSENTARYAGIRVPVVYVRTMALSGGVCGFAGFLAVSAVSHTLSTSTAGGRGFTAIIVAWLAKMNPFVMILISALLSFLDKGAVQIASDFGLNEYVSKIISGVILFFILGSEFFINYQVKTGAKHK